MKKMILVMGLVMLSGSSPSQATSVRPRIDRIKVMQISDWTLNENVNRQENPMAYRAFIDCNYMNDYFSEITLTDLSDPNDSNKSYSFYEFDDYSACYPLMKKLKANYRANKTSCLVVEKVKDSLNRSTSRLKVMDEEACQSPRN